ncbi:MAG: PEP-CTERM sorting domain-containing protein [Phycisphaeraceae bacterium]|nr:PEP-CTERM sorting domain-containing protein [Phycisphaeraceae bacterium]
MKKMLACAGLALGVATVASGQTFYATNNLSSANFGTAGDELITFDWNTALWSSVGVVTDSTGAPRGGLGGLDFDGRGNLYASDSFGANPGDIMLVNRNTAAATVINHVQTGIHDLAWDPNTGSLYGVDSAAGLWGGLDTTPFFVGNFNVSTLEVGLGFDSRGNMYVLDLISDVIYSANAGALTTLTALHTVPFNANFSQGLFVDWANGDLGYHGALNGSALNSPNHNFGSLVTGGGYNPVPSSVFATHTNGLPEVEVGDLTRIPAPASLALLGLGGLVAGRRRR